MSDPILWPFFPDWTGGILERLEWLTNVMQSPVGAEQRVSARANPRRTFEPNFYMHDAGRRRAALMIQDGVANDWYMPVWPDLTEVLVTIPEGATRIDMPTAGTDFEAGATKAVLRSLSDTTALFLVDVTSSDGDGIFVSAVPGGVPAPVLVYPARLMQFTSPPTVNRETDTLWRVQSEVRIVERSTWGAWTPDYMFEGFPIYDTLPNEDDSIVNTPERLWVELNDSISVPSITDTANLNFFTQTFHWTVGGRDKAASLREFLYYLRGRLNPVWMPSYYGDVKLISNQPGGDKLRIEATGYLAYAGLRAGTDVLYFLRRDGSSFVRRVTGVVELGSEIEELTLLDPLPVGWNETEILRVSFMALMRLQQDSIEIQHEADTHGVTMVSAVFRAAPNLRDAKAWEPMPVLMPFMSDTDCGCSTGCCNSPWVHSGGTPVDFWVHRYSDYASADVSAMRQSVLDTLTSRGASQEYVGVVEGEIDAFVDSSTSLIDSDAVLTALHPVLSSLGISSAEWGIKAYLDDVILSPQEWANTVAAMYVQMRLFEASNYYPTPATLNSAEAFRRSLPPAEDARILSEFCIAVEDQGRSSSRRGGTSGYWREAAALIQGAESMDTWQVPAGMSEDIRLTERDGVTLSLYPAKGALPLMFSEFYSALSQDDGQGGGYIEPVDSGMDISQMRDVASI